MLLSKLSLFPLLVFSCPAALQALKRKKRYEKQLAQIDGTLSTIEFQREALENANTNTEVLKNMGFAAKAMKAAHENMYERSSGSISKESFVISSFFFSFVVLAFICHRISVISLFLFFYFSPYVLSWDFISPFCFPFFVPFNNSSFFPFLQICALRFIYSKKCVCVVLGSVNLVLFLLLVATWL